MNYYRENGCLWVMTRRDRTWWRNVKKGANVSILIKGRTSNAFAEAELDEEAVEAHLLDYIRHIPMTAKSLGIQIENKTPDTGDVRRVAKDRLFVKIRPNSSF